jgi:DNA invertase Pin-like site-specific DNA recombinase
MLIGYARVSTHDQTTALQLDALRAAGCDRIFQETGSGSRTDRPELAKALDMLRSGDVLVIWRFDRIGRSTQHLLGILNDLKTKGVEIKSLTEGVDTTTSTGRLMFGIIAMFAEFERSLITERAAAGRVAAKARGIVGGRAKILNNKQVAALKVLAADPTISVPATLQSFNISKTTYYRYIRNKL